MAGEGATIASAAIGAATGVPGAGGGLPLNLSNEVKSRSGSITVGGLNIGTSTKWDSVAMWSVVGILGLSWIAGRKKKRGK